MLGLWTRAGVASCAWIGRVPSHSGAGSGSENVRWLDVAVLSGTLARMIGASEGALTAEGRLSYTHDRPCRS